MLHFRAEQVQGWREVRVPVPELALAWEPEREPVLAAEEELEYESSTARGPDDDGKSYRVSRS